MNATVMPPRIGADGPHESASHNELAENLLRRSHHLALRRIDCEMQGNVLVLRGCLPSYFLKQVAQSTVAQAEGVQEIENEIEVIAGSATR
ncbi:MAG: BON domain-containing protein [Planctomycetia bacterium]|nr:BON domain-containing protein [Planctomycetia bacterium]